MNFDFSEEQLLIQENARKISDELIRPSAAERDQKQIFPREIIKELGELGYFGMLIPEEYGGVGFDMISYSLVLQEFSKADASVAVIISVTNSLAANSIYKFGTEKQKEDFLKPLAEGKMLGAFALSEAGSGSDAASLRMTAEDKGDHYLLNGEKMWITSAQNADIFIVFAKTDTSVKNTKGISAFIVPKDVNGFEIVTKEEKMGLCSSDTCTIRFENTKLPKENLLGEVSKGFNIAMSLLNGGRIGIASQALGIGQAAFEASLQYSKDREQFGKAISEFQAIQNKIARMATKLESSRLLTFKACELYNSNLKADSIASMAKLTASENAVSITEQAIQVFGGNGYTKDFPVERYFRDAKVTEIYEGTSQIQQIVIARNILK